MMWMPEKPAVDRAQAPQLKTVIRPHKTMTRVDRIYAEIRSNLIGALPNFGFALQVDETSGPFGSRYVEFHCEERAVRFLWDGREGWFLLGYCIDLSVEPSPKWEDLYFKKVDIRHSDNEIYEDVERSLAIAIEDLKEKLEGV